MEDKRMASQKQTMPARFEILSFEDIIRRIVSEHDCMPTEDEAWYGDDVRQSRIIESILMHIPPPPIYRIERPDARPLVFHPWIHALTRFTRDAFPLCGLVGERAQLNGRRWSNLPLDLRTRIMRTPLIVYIIDAHGSDAALMDMLDRMLENGAPPRQVVRHMLHAGDAVRWIRSMAQSDVFLHATRKGFAPETWLDCEAITRFCAFFLLGFPSYAQWQGDMDAFLGAALDAMNARGRPGLDRDVAPFFFRSMRNNATVFEERAFRRSGMNGVEPISMALFEVYALALAPMSPSFVVSHRDGLKQIADRLLADPEFLEAITNDIDTPHHVNIRFRRALEAHINVFPSDDTASRFVYRRLVSIEPDKMRNGSAMSRQRRA